MRFLLRPFSPPAVGSKGAAPLAGTSAQGAAGTGRAWGQQCGSNCGCVLRIEAELSEGASSTSYTIVRSSYHAKRVMTTAHERWNDGINLRPLITQHSSRSQPILTACTCPTLHHLAQRAVDYLRGKTLAQIRNEMDMGVVGPRSSVAFRHTVLQENVLPAIAATSKKKLLHNRVGEAVKCTSAHEMNSTTRYDHCYDLVEDTLLSMVHERMPSRRKDDKAESYSPTLGYYFRMYSSSGRKQPVDLVDDSQRNESVGGQEHSIHEASDWLRRSPSSFFLFGDESNSAYMSDLLRLHGTLIQFIQDSFSNRLFGNETKISTPIEDETGEDRPTTTYLQMLDMYGSDTMKKDNDRAMADWLEYVDRNSQDENIPTSA